jgi:hypothetical protein
VVRFWKNADAEIDCCDLALVRYNLDPFDDYTDEEIWSALEKSHIKAKVRIDSLKLCSVLCTNNLINLVMIW